MLAQPHSSPWSDGRMMRLFDVSRRDWSLELEEETYLKNEMMARQLQFGSADVHGRGEFITVEPGLSLVILDTHIPHGWLSQLVGEDLLEFHARLDGRILLSGDWGHVELTRPSLLIWHQPADHNDVHEELGGSGAYEKSITLFCSRLWLQDNLGADLEDLLPDFASAIRGETNDPTYGVFPLFPELAPILDDIVQDKGTGFLRLVTMKARAYEFLAVILRAFSVCNIGKSVLAPRLADAVAHARLILDGNYVTPPSLVSLSRQLGLNAHKLAAALKFQYGQTYKQIIAENRMEAALALLRSSDKHIGEISAAVGYSHHSTFSAAFTKRFGVPPKSMSTYRSAHASPVTSELLSDAESRLT